MLLADLDRVGDDALHVLDDGRVGVLPRPADLSWQEVVVALDTPHSFLAVLAPTARMSYAAAEALQAAWQRHHDLPDREQARRLVYLVHRYHDDLEIDVPALGELWRARRWRYLLNLIDHLHRWSWYARAVANDEDAAKVMAQRYLADDSKEKTAGEHRVALEHWTPEVEHLLGIQNELRALRTTLVAVNSTTRPGQPTYLLGPETAFQRAVGARRAEVRRERHARVVARLQAKPLPVLEPGTLPVAPTDV